jgi:hypothetical protein
LRVYRRVVSGGGLATGCDGIRESYSDGGLCGGVEWANSFTSYLSEDQRDAKEKAKAKGGHERRVHDEVTRVIRVQH